MSKNVQVFGKLPIDAFEIRSEKEHRLLLTKTIAFIVLDIILFICLILVIHYDQDNSLIVLVVYMSIMLAASFIIDVWTWIQINLHFIHRRLAIFSLLLDICIFVGGIWEIIKFTDEVQLGSKETLFGIVVVVLTFLRVSNIVSILLYAVFCMPLYCFPETCYCRKILDKDEIEDGAL